MRCGLFLTVSADRCTIVGVSETSNSHASLSTIRLNESCGGEGFR